MKVRIAVHYDGADAPGGVPLASLVELVRAAESAGFDVAWVAESALDAPGGLPAAMPVCAALVAATERIRVGTAVLPLPLHHPVRVAEDAASVDAIAGGRFELGVGLGADPRGFQGFGVAVPERVARFEEAVDLIRLAWEEGPVDFRGRHYQLAGIEVVPKPHSPPPIWVGAASDEAQRRAARLGAGLWSRAPGPPEAYLDAWLAAGRSAGEARVALRGDAPDPAACRRTLDALVGRVGQVDLVLPALALGGDAVGAALQPLRSLAAPYTPAEQEESPCP